MLIRTNIYLPRQVVRALKKKAALEKTSMAQIVRIIVEGRVAGEAGDWTNSLLALARKAGKSRAGDLAERHDKYLYGKK